MIVSDEWRAVHERYNREASRRARNAMLLRFAVIALLVVTYVTFPYWGAPK